MYIEKHRLFHQQQRREEDQLLIVQLYPFITSERHSKLPVATFSHGQCELDLVNGESQMLIVMLNSLLSLIKLPFSDLSRISQSLVKDQQSVLYWYINYMYKKLKVWQESGSGNAMVLKVTVVDWH